MSDESQPPQTLYYDYSKEHHPLHLPIKVLQTIELNVIHKFLGGGPKDGHKPAIKVTKDISEAAFATWSPRRATYSHRGNVSNKLYWEATVQDTWETSVFRRGIQMVEGHPVLFARRLATKHFETFEVRALQRGPGFTATLIPGFVFRLTGVCHFHQDRKLGIRRFKRAVREHTVALLSQDTLT